MMDGYVLCLIGGGKRRVCMMLEFRMRDTMGERRESLGKGGNALMWDTQFGGAWKGME